MKINEIFLFDGVGQKDVERMLSCFDVKRGIFEPGETIWDFEHTSDKIGIVMSGSVSIVRMDASGNRAVLESLSENDVFGEMFAFSDDMSHGVFAMCERKCEIAYMKYGQISKRCGNACRCHTLVVENMFRVVTKKAQRMAERIEILSNRTIREKLLCFFAMCSGKEESKSFLLPFSLSYLADYICADRSAMMRELRRMAEEGIVKTEKRKIELLQ